jgi:hypothetical protein
MVGLKYRNQSVQKELLFTGIFVLGISNANYAEPWPLMVISAILKLPTQKKLIPKLNMNHCL